jgi:hypothetical protein
VKITMPERYRMIVVILVFSILLLAGGCDLLPGGEFLGLPLTQATPRPTSTPAVVEPTATPEETEPEEIETEQPAVETLLLWVPPFMDPNSDTDAGRLLAAQLDLFEAMHDDVNVVVRVKAETGSASLVESLVSTSSVAPLELPSLVVLGRRDMENVARRGLILPLGDYSNVINELDWYQYSRVISVISESSYGLPLVGESMVMVVRSSDFTGLNNNWESFIEADTLVGFLANDPEATQVLMYYLALEGRLLDEEDQLMLDEALLAQVYRIFEEATAAGIIPEAVLQANSYEEIWDGFLAGNYPMVIVPSTFPLQEKPADTFVIPVTPITNLDFTLGRGWMLALADPLPERRELAVELAETLADARFTGPWSQALGYLPMRRTALDLWGNTTQVQRYSAISISANPYPSIEIINQVGPILQEGLLAVLNQTLSAEEAAAAAAAKLPLED